jgi:hypothetical protein
MIFSAGLIPAILLQHGNDLPVTGGKIEGAEVGVTVPRRRPQ